MRRTRRRAGRVLLLAAAWCTVGLVGVPAGARAADPAPPSGPEVTVLDRGGAPRVPLRYAPTVGTSNRIRMEMSSDVAQTLSGQTRRVSTPPVTFTLTTTVTAVDPDGTLHLHSRYDAVDVGGSGDVHDSMTQALEPMVGMTADSVVSATGTVLVSAIAVPDGASDQLRSQVESFSSQASELSAPLPEDAVGPGARWRVTTGVTASGISVEQSTTYTLEKVDGPRLTMSSTLAQTGNRQKVDNPTGASFVLVSSRGTGSGRSEVDLTLGTAPTNARAAIEIRQVVRAQGQTLRQTVGMDITMSTNP